MTVDDEMPPDPFPPPRPVRRRGPDGRAYVELDIEVVPLNLDGPDLAGWCDRCLLPSGIGYRFVALVGGRPTTRFALVVCRDCGDVTRRVQ